MFGPARSLGPAPFLAPHFKNRSDAGAGGVPPHTFQGGTCFWEKVRVRGRGIKRNTGSSGSRPLSEFECIVFTAHSAQKSMRCAEGAQSCLFC